MRAIPDRPEAEARPVPPRNDLLGRQPVRIRAAGGNLVATGFGRQQIEIPAAAIGSVIAHGQYSSTMANHGPGLAVLDHDQHLLLRAAGSWDSSDLRPVLDELGLPAPRWLTRSQIRRQRRQHWTRAAGYRRLRVRPRGYVPLATARVLLFLGVMAGGVFLGAAIGVALPYGFGAVRGLAGLTAAAVLAIALPWLLVRSGQAAVGTIRWAAVSLSARSPAPVAPFIPKRGRPEAIRKLVTAAMVAAVPVLIGWGPGVGIGALVHGLSDQALVSTLRSQGLITLGRVVDVPTYSTDSGGDTVVTAHATLSYVVAGGRFVTTPDPGIGGRHWPINPAVIVPVVYDPAHPSVAAVRGQITGSPWAGPPTADLISGGLLTLALPFLVWRVRRRIRLSRRAQAEDFMDGIF